MQILTLPPAMVRRIENLIGMRIPTISIPVKAGSLYRKTLQEGEPQLINDPKTIQGLMAEFTENKMLKKLVPKIYTILDIRSVINVPLVSKGEAIGLLDVSRKEPFTEFDVKRLEAISGQLTSIIERKKAEQELSKERILFKAIIDNIPVLLTRYDPDTNMLYLNKEFEKIIGWKTEEVKDIDLMEKVYPDPDYRKQAREYMQKASTEWREFLVQSKSGKIIYSEWSNIRMDDGTQIGIGIDTTKRKKAEEEIRKSEELYRTLFMSNPVETIIVDTEGKIVAFNEAKKSLVTDYRKLEI